MKRVIVAAILLCLFYTPVWAVVAYDNATTALQNASTNTVTFSHTTSGSNRALLVYIPSVTSGTTVSSITYAGTGLTALGTISVTGGVQGQLSLWGMVNPASGANNVVVTLGASNIAWDAIAISFTGVHQTFATAFTGLQSALSGTSASITVTVTTGQAGDMVSSGTCSLAANGTTPGAGSTQRWVDNSGSSNTQGSTKAGAASVAMTENWDAAGNNEFAVIAVNIAQAAAAATPAYTRRYVY